MLVTDVLAQHIEWFSKRAHHALRTFERAHHALHTFERAHINAVRTRTNTMGRVPLNERTMR
jgi:hypothetical protein